MFGAAGFWNGDCGSEIVNSEAEELLVFMLSRTVPRYSNQDARGGMLCSAAEWLREKKKPNG
jgi:hypothetical protein